MATIPDAPSRITPLRRFPDAPRAGRVVGKRTPRFPQMQNRSHAWYHAGGTFQPLQAGESALQIALASSSADVVHISSRGRGRSVQAYSREEFTLEMVLTSRTDDGGIAQHGIAIHVVRERAIRISGGAVPEASPEDAKGNLPASFMEAFSPEAVADRIFRFATAGFDPAGSTREDFRNFIMPYIQQGHDDAMVILGGLADSAQDLTGETMQGIRDKFDAFVAGEEVTGDEVSDTGKP